MKYIIAFGLLSSSALAKGHNGHGPQTTGDSNCAGVYGEGDPAWSGCLPDSDNRVQFIPSDVELEGAHGNCDNYNKHSKYAPDTVNATLRLSIAPFDPANPVNRNDFGIFLSASEDADSSSPNDCQHYFLSPITPDIVMQDVLGGNGPFFSISDRCGDIVATEPNVELVVEAQLVCTKKGQTVFDISYCITWNANQPRNCMGLPGAIPFLQNDDVWSPCSCKNFFIDTYDYVYSKGSYGKGYDDHKGYENSHNDKGYGYEDDHKGYDVKHGYDDKGYDNKGYDDKNGYDNKGYDNKGYDDKNGYDDKGYDNKGYGDKNGYDDKGYDVKGYDNKGYNIQGYDDKGYNDKGYDTLGYDNKGYDNKGYTDKGYDVKGYTEKGYSEQGVYNKAHDKSVYDAPERKGPHRRRRRRRRRAGYENNKRHQPVY